MYYSYIIIIFLQLQNNQSKHSFDPPFGNNQRDHSCSRRSRIRCRSVPLRSCCRRYWHWHCRSRCQEADKSPAPDWQSWHFLSGRHHLSQTRTLVFSAMNKMFRYFLNNAFLTVIWTNKYTTGKSLVTGFNSYRTWVYPWDILLPDWDEDW